MQFKLGERVYAATCYGCQPYVDAGLFLLTDGETVAFVDGMRTAFYPVDRVYQTYKEAEDKSKEFVK